MEDEIHNIVRFNYLVYSKYTMATLSDICKYYIDCVANEGIKVSIPSTSRRKIKDYIQLNSFPTENFDWTQNEILSFIANYRGANFYVGFPTFLKEIQTEKGQKYFKIEPIFLYRLNFQNNIVSMESPVINFEAIKSLCDSSESQIVNDVINLEETLGFYDNLENVNNISYVQKLKNITQNWNWKNEQTQLEFSKETGIYDSPILLHIEQNTYTQGLVQELRELSKLTDSQVSDSALGYLLSQKYSIQSVKQNSILEVLPLNEEQRDSVKSALSSPVTIITGPPGTGKSQVIGDLIINAVLNKKKVLFASKNNKAVDIIDERINSIGDRPILLRQGSNQYSHNLAKYLLSLLHLSGTQQDKDEYNEKVIEYKSLIKKIKDLKEDALKVKNYRNEVDEEDQKVLSFRLKQGQEFIDRFSNIDLAYVNNILCEFKSKLEKVNPSSFHLIDKIIWKIYPKKRINVFENSLEVFKKVSSDINLEFQNLSLKYDLLNVDDYIIAVKDFENQLKNLLCYKDYLRKVNELQKLPTLEEINQELFYCNDKILELSERIWNLYLIIQSMNLTRTERQTLTSFVPLMKSIISNDETQGLNLTNNQYQNYVRLLEKCSDLLPCWAVTSLSARSGKIPFIKNYYDIVIFDEASQCDIASALPLLYRAKQMVIIGDPNQLSHITSLKSSDERKLRQKYNFSAEDARFSYITNSLYNICEGVVETASEIITLREHYRSISDIINFSNEEFYNNTLRVATAVNNLSFCDNVANPVVWDDIKGESIRPKEGGLLNIVEAEAVVKKLRNILIDNSYIGTVGIVSPFRAQVNKIRELIHRDTELVSRLNSSNLLINTAHGFQGDERDIIIFSPVVSKNVTSGAINFLNKDFNIFNVAITRARAHLIIIGDREVCLNSEVSYLAKFAKYVIDLENKYRNKYPEVSNSSLVSDIERMFYNKLLEKGISVIPQYQTSGYSLDFALITKNGKLNIEIDGKNYHKKWNGDTLNADRIRTQRLFEDGWTVMRFWVYEVINNSDACIKKIQRWLEQNE